MTVSKYEQASLRIMTHNVLNEEPGGRDLRFPVLYRKYSPDVLCLQEMALRIRTEAMIKGLEEDYEFVEVETYGNANYTPILLKKGEFKVLEAGWHLYTGYNDQDSKSITWAAVERIKTGERFGIASTHYWWEAEGEDDEASRLSNVREMTAFVHYLQVKYDMPVFAMGDLNCDMRSRPYRAIQETGALDAMTCATVSASRKNTCHEYPVMDENGIYGNGPELTGTCLDSIDHIFVYGMPRVEVYVHDIVSEQLARDISDHTPVYIDCTVLPRDPNQPRVVRKHG